MSKLISTKTWIVLFDGAKALVLENAGDAEILDLRVVESMSHPAELTAELGTDRPGRVQQLGKAVRHAVENRDLHDAAETLFITQLVQKLEDAVRDHLFSAMIVVSPPRSMGKFRRIATHALRASLIGEISKDLVALPIDEIERHIKADVGEMRLH